MWTGFWWFIWSTSVESIFFSGWLPGSLDSAICERASFDSTKLRQLFSSKQWSFFTSDPCRSDHPGSMGLGSGSGQSSPAGGQSPSAAGTFDPTLQQSSGHYKFLVNGELASGQLTLSVHPTVIEKIEEQIVRWTRNPSYIDGSKSTKGRHQRYSNTRVFKVSMQRNPPAGETPNVACKDCANKGVISTLVGKDGPIIVPLPVSERSIGATPLNGEYYVKERRIVNVMFLRHELCLAVYG